MFMVCSIWGGCADCAADCASVCSVCLRSASGSAVRLHQRSRGEVENVRRLGLGKTGMTIAGRIYMHIVCLYKFNKSLVSQSQTLSSEESCYKCVPISG